PDAVPLVRPRPGCWSWAKCTTARATPTLLDDDAFDARLGLRVPKLEPFEALDHGPGNEEVPHPLPVRRDDAPRRLPGVTEGQHVGTGGHVVVPVAALFKIGAIELPPLPRGIDACLEAFALLVVR